MVTFGSVFNAIFQYWYIITALIVVDGVCLIFWFIKRKAKARIQEKRHEVDCLLFEGDVRKLLTIPSADIKDFASMRFRIIDKRPVYLIKPYKQAPVSISVIAEMKNTEAKLKTLDGRSREAKKLRAYLETLGNGHKQQVILQAVGTAVSEYKYEAWQPNPIPLACGKMTPNWLYRGIHWEEQAKVARVKNTGMHPILKYGTIVVVLVLAIIAIFLFGVILMDKT